MLDLSLKLGGLVKDLLLIAAVEEAEERRDRKMLNDLGVEGERQVLVGQSVLEAHFPLQRVPFFTARWKLSNFIWISFLSSEQHCDPYFLRNLTVSITTRKLSNCSSCLKNYSSKILDDNVGVPYESIIRLCNWSGFFQNIYSTFHTQAWGAHEVGDDEESRSGDARHTEKKVL